MADEPKVYSKEGFPDREFTDAQIENLGEGADGWKRKKKPATPPEIDSTKQQQAAPTDVVPKQPVIIEAVATDVDQANQTNQTDGDNTGSQTPEGDGSDGNEQNSEAAGPLPNPAEKVTGRKKKDD